MCRFDPLCIKNMGKGTGVRLQGQVPQEKVNRERGRGTNAHGVRTREQVHRKQGVEGPGHMGQVLRGMGTTWGTNIFFQPQSVIGFI